MYAEFRFGAADFFVRSVGGNLEAKTTANTTALFHEPACETVTKRFRNIRAADGFALR